MTDRVRSSFGAWRVTCITTTGLWPFLLTADADMLPDLVHFAANEADSAELSRGEALNSDDVLREMAAMAASDDEPDDKGGERGESTYDWEASAVTPNVLEDIEGRLRRDRPYRLALIEAAHGWEVPARLGWSGAVNYDLSGAQHVAVLRRWSQRYGANLLTLGFDTIELVVERPPAGPLGPLLWDGAPPEVVTRARCGHSGDRQRVAQGPRDRA